MVDGVQGMRSSLGMIQVPVPPLGKFLLSKFFRGKFTVWIVRA